MVPRQPNDGTLPRSFGGAVARSGHGGGAVARSGADRPATRRRRRGQGGDGAPVVPDATFTSYYGRPVLKASPWQDDIPAYLFLGGLAAGSSLLAAGADLTGRPALRRAGRLAGLSAITLGLAALVHDLGRPSRFANMLRVAKPTSPMSVGTWILSVYGPLASVAGAAEIAQEPRGSDGRREFSGGSAGRPGSAPRSSRPRSRRTRPYSLRTPRRRRGMRHIASCRSSSRDRPRPRRAVWA